MFPTSSFFLILQKKKGKKYKKCFTEESFLEGGAVNKYHFHTSWSESSAQVTGHQPWLVSDPIWGLGVYNLGQLGVFFHLNWKHRLWRGSGRVARAVVHSGSPPRSPVGSHCGSKQAKLTTAKELYVQVQLLQLLEPKCLFIHGFWADICQRSLPPLTHLSPTSASAPRLAMWICQMASLLLYSPQNEPHWLWWSPWFFRLFHYQVKVFSLLLCMVEYLRLVLYSLMFA